MKITDVMDKSVKDAMVSSLVKTLNQDPENNTEKIYNTIRKSLKDEGALNQVDYVYHYYQTSKPTHEYVQNILKTTDKKCLEKFFVNFLANANWYATPRREKYYEKNNVKIPFVILISPSMRCNLRCAGCYAAKYSKKDDIPFEEVDRIIKEGRDLGVYYYIILGGEPFINSYMLDIYEKYPDVMFSPFTNGTLIDEKTADRIKSLGNVVPMLSLEGFEKETDARRGKGTFKKVMHAMDLFKERGILFGVSTATSTHNLKTVVSDEFINMLIEKGSKLSWYFLYMPVGQNPNVKDMLKPEERLYLGERSRYIRAYKPYFTIDFFNDAPYVGGCIAGKYYCHINSHEDVEPCIFAHFACANLKGKKLIDVLSTDFFKELRKRQPYNKNMLLPCMMIDNPNVVREVVKKTGAYPTDDGADKMINDPEFMGQLDELAAGFKPYAAKAWEEVFHKEGNDNLAK